MVVWYILDEEHFKAGLQILGLYMVSAN